MEIQASGYKETGPVVRRFGPVAACPSGAHHVWALWVFLFVCFVLDEVWGFYKCRHPSAAAHPHFMLSVQFFLTNINGGNLGSSTQAL